MEQPSTLQIPERPCLKPWLRLAHEPGSAVLQYGDRVVSFDGRGVGALIGSVFPLLDGRRTVTEIGATLGVEDASAISSLLARLAREDLLLDGPDPLAEAPDLPRQATRFVTAAFDVPRTLPEAHDLVEQAAIGIVGTGVLAEEAARALRLSGVRRLDPLPWRPAADEARRYSLVLALPRGDELPRLPDWNGVALAAGTPWLQVLPFDGQFAAIGPLYLPGESCCYECYRRRRAANVSYPREFWALENSPAPYPSILPLDWLLAGLGSLLALKFLIEGAQTRCAGRLYALELRPEISLQAHTVYRVPRCPACAPASQASAPQVWYGE